MLLLVTGASGVGKTSARRLLQPQVALEVECAELCDLSPNPQAIDLGWRQRTTGLAVQRAVELQREGRHFLLCGDPTAAVEVAAAPSAPQLEGLAFCLLDADAATQSARLATRGDDPASIPHHHAFADWMRHQATDPLHMLEVVTTNAWDQMCWDRLPVLAPHWDVNVIETTTLTPDDVANAILAWLRSSIAATETWVRVSPDPHGDT